MSQGKSAPGGGNSACAGPEKGLLGKLKDDRRPMWLEDSRCRGQRWEGGCNDENTPCQVLSPQRGVQILFQVWCQELVPQKQSLRRGPGEGVCLGGMRLCKDLEGKGIHAVTIQVPTAGNRGSVLPELREGSRGPPRSALLKDWGAAPFSTSSLSSLFGGHLLGLYSAHLHPCTGQGVLAASKKVPGQPAQHARHPLEVGGCEQE